MKKLIYILLILFTIITLNGCFTSGHINSSGSVGMSVGGNIFK
ncbi:hypothetical protein [Aliarcobacter faecis]|nr:hypothetical protein [Aliarcobacter faecis]